MRVYAKCEGARRRVHRRRDERRHLGLENGYCLMVGGDANAVKRANRSFYAGARRTATRTSGPRGAGHFSKMVHNGIEYGMLQPTARVSRFSRSRQFHTICTSSPSSGCTAAWSARGCSSSWSSRLSEIRISKDIRGYVDDSGEGRWTVQAAIDENVPAPVITLSLIARLARGKTNRSAPRSSRRCATNSAATPSRANRDA